MKIGQFTATLEDNTVIAPSDRLTTLESIAFQKNHPAGPELEALVIKYMNLVEAKTSPRDIEADKELKKEFNDITRKHFGLNATLFTNSILAATMPNVYVEHSAVVRDALRSYLRYDSSAAGQDLLNNAGKSMDLGTVNTETAKITGWLSEQLIPVYINFTELMKMAKFSSAEITAIILHELGHDFMGAAMAARINQTNQIIADVVHHISNKDRGGDVNYVYKELSKIDDQITKDTVEGLMNGNAVVVGVSAFRVLQGVVRSISGASAYDRTSFETLADSFAVRMGYGAPLASGLEKITSQYKYLSMFAEAMYLAAMVGSLITAFKLMSIVLTGKVSFMIIVALIQNLLAVMTLVDHKRVKTGDYEYDNTHDRFARIKRNIIEQLKNDSISAKDKRMVLEQLQVVDEALNASINVPSPLRSALKLVFASDRVSQRSIDAQQEIEKLIANDIFVSASKLDLKGR